MGQCFSVYYRIDIIFAQTGKVLETSCKNDCNFPLYHQQMFEPDTSALVFWHALFNSDGNDGTLIQMTCYLFRCYNGNINDLIDCVF